MWRYGLNTMRSLVNYHRCKLCLNNYPVIQGIEVTNACNLNCSFCKRDRVKQRGIGYMTWKTFHNVVNPENKDMLRHTRLFMHGEPLLHPQLPRFIEEARQYAKTIGFTTNGILLTYEKSRQLLEAGLNAICFSGHTPSIIKNIHCFLELKQLINPSCHVSLALVDPHETEYLTTLKVDGIDNVVIQSEHDWGLTGVRQDVCLWPWWGLTVYWNGDVAPCCLYEDMECMGNVNKQSIKEIWNNPQYVELRKNMLNGKACPTCSISHITINESYLHVHKPDVWTLPRSLIQMMGSIL